MSIRGLKEDSEKGQEQLANLSISKERCIAIEFKRRTKSKKKG
jgi:hypothetical protein